MNMAAANGIRIHRNPRAAPRAEPYGSARARILNQAGFVAAEEEISRWPGYAATPSRAARHGRGWSGVTA